MVIAAKPTVGTTKPVEPVVVMVGSAVRQPNKASAAEVAELTEGRLQLLVTVCKPAAAAVAGRGFASSSNRQPLTTSRSGGYLRLLRPSAVNVEQARIAETLAALVFVERAAAVVAGRAGVLGATSASAKPRTLPCAAVAAIPLRLRLSSITLMKTAEEPRIVKVVPPRFVTAVVKSFVYKVPVVPERPT